MIRREREVMDKGRQLRSDCTIFFLTDAVDRDWNRLFPSVVQLISSASFNSKHDRYLLHLSVHWVTLSFMAAAEQYNNCHLGLGQTTWFGPQVLCGLLIYVKLGHTLMQHVASVLISVTSALEPVAGRSPLPRDTGPE